MYTPTHSSPRLELRPKRVKAEHAIMDANRLVHKEDYPAGLRLYTRLLDETSHPAYYLNRALCYVAMGQPHLAVNDALRAYMMAQSILDATRSKGDVNDHIRRIDARILTYTAPSTMFELEHQNFKLARMTIVKEEFEDQNVEKKVFTPAPFDLKYKALFRLVDALSRCGRGPAYNALHLLGDILMEDAGGANKKAFQPFVRQELDALAKHVQDKLLDDVIEGKMAAADLQLTQTGFSLLSSAHYGFAERPINYNILNNYILTIDSDSIVHYEYKFGMPAALAATQDVFEGMVLFTESLPFVVSTANTPDQSRLAIMCDACGTDLQMPAPLVLRVLVEELKQAGAESSSVNHRRTVAVDTPLGTPPRSGSTDKDRDTDFEQRIPQAEGRDYGEVGGDQFDEDWNSESSSDKTDTCSDHTAPTTPVRGRITSRPGIFETSDVQICRYGKEKQRENFSFCSVDCFELAKATYHDSICGSHIEDYLRKSIIQVENSGLPSVDTQKLVLLLLVRVLGWAYATSTDPLDLPVIQLFMASPRRPSLKDELSIPWSFHNNVMRPYQMYQAMDGRGDAPKSVTNPDYSDGSIINTIISLIQRHIVICDKVLWTKTYDEDGYHEQTYRYSDKEHTDEDESTLFGRLHPLCDLVPLVPKPEDANVELVDLGGGQIICLPIFTNRAKNIDSVQCIKKGTRLLLHSPAPRFATNEERVTYAKVEDYGKGGTMMDAERDESMLEESDTEGELQTEEQEEEYSEYLDEETYGADDEYMADAEFEIDEDDEEMMNF
ncbi:unnamed protein product [Aureobasidium uvarum]|uniref:Uncharacterized protein n=1 Tax=Aureobasidium uvarum TaxID=2773716 RepID=A0A9N8KQ06_9PEZI|nr:unnamed protein product [Aureobasidium uvarum]